MNKPQPKPYILISDQPVIRIETILISLAEDIKRECACMGSLNVSTSGDMTFFVLKPWASYGFEEVFEYIKDLCKMYDR